MRQLGCIPTQKFVSDLTLVRDIVYAVKKKKNSVLMYPEASYSFDGTTTPLPDSLGRFIKMLGVPVVMITTYGAFARDPLYNNLQLRQVDVSADMTYLLSPEEIAQKTPDELNAILAKSFSLDYFRWQQQKGIHITEDFRADHLNRVLYQCPHCMTEGCMVGKGTALRCENCGKTYELTEDGFLRPLAGEAAFTHVPDWYRWEREQVRASLLAGTYRLDIPVDICMMVNDKCIYRVGEGRLVHTCAGFHLTGCNGALDYKQKPNASYGLYADYYWYELGDVICIGYDRVLYYCFPKGGCDVVAKTRLAVEELYKMERQAATQKRKARSAMPAES